MREAKRLIKKYATLQASIDSLIVRLTEDALIGIHYGDGIYKIRLADKSKGKDKSGGFRVLYYYLKEREQIVDIILMSIFDKSEKATVMKNEALDRLKQIQDEHLKN